MTPQVNLSMEELSRLALGGNSMSHVQIVILHNLINLILKKLNCRQETVSIGGYESQCLQKLLKTSSITPMPFNDENIEVINLKLDKVPVLEERITALDQKMEKHFESIRQCHALQTAADNPFDFAKWESYEMMCEDLCTTCEPENEIPCGLLMNAGFMRKLMRRIAKPMVDRILELEGKIERLHEELNAFIKRAEEQYKKIEVLQKCIYEIESLRERLNRQHSEFIATMQEVQDMFDAKLDKVHIPAMKKWIRDQYEKIEGELKHLQKVEKCPKAAGIIMGDVACISCGADKVCAAVHANTVGVLPDSHPGKPLSLGCEEKKKKWKENCICSPNKSEPTLMQRITHIEANLDHLVAPNIRKKKGQCKLGRSEKIEFVTGTDGNLYRAA